jgi:hypothetical protein
LPRCKYTVGSDGKGKRPAFNIALSRFGPNRLRPLVTNFNRVNNVQVCSEGVLYYLRARQHAVRVTPRCAITGVLAGRLIVIITIRPEDNKPVHRRTNRITGSVPRAVRAARAQNDHGAE